MKIVIVGAGSIGFQLARQLIDEGRDLIVLEKNPARHRYANERLDCKVELTSASDMSMLQSVIQEADLFLALTNSDEVNLAYAYVVGAQFPNLKKIIRIRNLDYKAIPIIEDSVAGPCFVVHPSQETAMAMIKTIEHGAVGDIYEFADGEIQLRSFLLNRNQNQIIGKDIQQLRKDSSISFLIPLLCRKNRILLPSAQTTLQDNDTIYIAAEKHSLGRLMENWSLKEQNIGKNVVILGGGEIAIAVGRLLLQQGEHNEEPNKKPGSDRGQQLKERQAKKEKGLFHSLAKWFRKTVNLRRYHIKYIERDYERCKAIHARLQGIEVLNADVSEEDLFEEENLAEAHIFIAATDNQELNIVTALYAKNSGIRRAIVLVRTKQMHNVATSLGLDVIVSTSNTMINSIMRHVHGDNVHRIQSLVDGDMEILELQVGATSDLIDRALGEIRFPDENTIITYIYRNGVTILPNGSTILSQGDRVVLITNKALRERLVQLFNGNKEKTSEAPSLDG